LKTGRNDVIVRESTLPTFIYCVLCILLSAVINFLVYKKLRFLVNRKVGTI